jgi:putative oxidoreductase
MRVMRLKTKFKIVFESSWTELILRWFLGFIFIYASLHKIVDPSYFAKILYGYNLLPGFSINLIAIFLPYLELYAGLFLIMGIYPRSAAILINGLLFIFIMALSINVIRQHKFDCGCFSFGKPVEYTNPRLLIIRDIFYLFCGLYVVFYDKSRKWCAGT